MPNFTLIALVVFTIAAWFIAVTLSARAEYRRARDLGYKDRSFGEYVNTWGQVLGLAGAAIWVGSTFVWKEWTTPRSAPVNISLNLQLQQAGGQSLRLERDSFVPVELKVSATNPSTRTVYLKHSAWWAEGTRTREGKATPQQIAEGVNLIGFNYVETLEISKPEIFAAGGLFDHDGYLRPGEAIGRTVVFHVPPGRYDVVTVHIKVPSNANKTDNTVRWEPSEENRDLEPHLWSPQNKEIFRDKDGDRRFPGEDRELDYSSGSAAVAVSSVPAPKGER